MYAALGNLLSVCLAILSVGAVGIVGAFLLGFFGTNQRATKKNEWEFKFSFRAKEPKIESALPVKRSEAIYFMSLTACIAYVCTVLAAFKWFVINPNAQAIYNNWFLLYRSSNNDGALKATAVTTFLLMLIVGITIGLTMRFGRLLKTWMLQKKNMKHGYVVPHRSRGLLIYPVCFICTFSVAMCEKVSKVFKRALAAARR